jgi:hypothetical protein
MSNYNQSKEECNKSGARLPEIFSVSDQKAVERRKVSLFQYAIKTQYADKSVSY